MTHTDPRCQFLIDYEISKLDWMEEGPRRAQAEHLAKVRVLSMPWQDMLDLYAKTKWEENHGRIRVTQHMKKDPETGVFVATNYVMEQNVNGHWSALPVLYTYEGEE